VSKGDVDCIVRDAISTSTRGLDRRVWGRGFGELLIDCEEDRVLRAVLVGMLREA
jgi:hypothetical protein